MFGIATLSIPASGFIGPVTVHGLSDQLALIMGRTAAWTLSNDNDCVCVALSDGSMKLIGLDLTTYTLVYKRFRKPSK